MRTPLIDLINMRTSLICKLLSLDSVTSRSHDVNKHGGGVNNLNPLGPDAMEPKQIWLLGLITSTLLLFLSRHPKNKYGRRAHHLKPNLNTW